MRKTLLVIFFLQFLAVGKSQSIIVNGTGMPETNYGAEQLLTDVLLDGGLCSSTSNFQLKDNPSEAFPSLDRSWGYFEKANSNFPFERGIILTTGFAINAEGPNDDIQSDGDYDWTGDAEATYLANAGTNNATVFEFDFVPQGNEISFNYIFASEEYPEFSCNSSYNDVFAFIISGPGISNDPGLNGKNIALLPNGQPVTINNVNDQGCGDDTYYVAGPFNDIEHGGRTTPLTAYSAVQPGQTYHIRLLIADAGDTSYDSAVFLEAGSFNLGSTIVDGNGIDIGDNLMVCGQDEYTLNVNVDDPEVQLQWYFNDDPIPGATSNTLIIDESGLYRIEVTSGDCSATDEVDVSFGDLQTNGTEFTIEEVDEGGDGVENFNLTEIESDVMNDTTGIIFVYYHSYDDAVNQQNPITTPTNYPSGNATIYLRIQNQEGCYEIIEVHLVLAIDCIPAAPMCANEDFGTNIPSVVGGETAPPGPDYDCLGSEPNPTWFYFRIDEPGNLVFDLNQYTEPDQGGEGNDIDFIIWGPFEEVPCAYTDLTGDLVVDCSYSPFEVEEVNINGAQSGEYYVLLITNYSQDPGYFNLIFNTNQSTGSFDCTILGNAEYSECDNDGDGQVQFDLDAIADDLAEGDNTLEITFYSTEEDATNDTNNNIISSPYTVNIADAPATVYAQIKDANGNIEEIVNVTLSIYAGVTGAQNVSYETCDVGNDGSEVVDLTSFNVIANPGNYTISYYEEEQDAIDGNAAFIPDPSNYETGTTTVYVRIENENGCFAIAEINIEISGLEVDLGDDFSMCEGEFTLTANGDFSGFTDVTYTWRRNGGILDGETSNTLVIDQIGQYSVTVNTAEGCSGSDTVNVIQGEAPTITAITVGTDFVIVDATGGATPYQYSVTGVVWQDSNQFNNLQPGIYTMYVRSGEGCITSQQFAVLFIPTMFTPNGDSINDTWNIPGMEIYPGSDVVIYDRQGRLVYQSELSSSVIWNGFFMNGQKAPTQDYWYIINVTDGRKFTGHITVKSRGEKN